ncbi:MAG: DUF6261 family protein [Bacteroidota bacterium]|nr:DUF6261 family protein [Bacteroidota bacterium]
MKKTTFSMPDIGLLTIDDLYFLVKSACDKALLVSRLFDDTTTMLLTQLQENNEQMGLQANIPSRHDQTNQLIELNIARGLCVEEIKREIHIFLKCRDDKKKEAARELQQFLEPYWKFHYENLNSQSVFYFEVITKYQESPVLTDAASLLGIEMIFSNLESMNSSYDFLYKLRMSEMNEWKITGSDLKLQVTENYQAFCTVLKMMANSELHPEFISLLNDLHELHKSDHPWADLKKDKMAEPLAVY